MNKLIFTILMFLVGGFFVYLVFGIPSLNFNGLDPTEMYQRIIQERDFAINQAIIRGDYKCCISPPCTMCYMEANQWNNYTSGTCACDDLIALGEKPCPQCVRGSCEGEGSTCSL